MTSSVLLKCITNAYPRMFFYARRGDKINNQLVAKPNHENDASNHSIGSSTTLNKAMVCTPVRAKAS